MPQRYKTLHEAMIDVLSRRADRTSTLKELAAEIAARDLWVRPSDGAYPETKQIRARANLQQYRDTFEVLAEARVRLREHNQ